MSSAFFNTFYFCIDHIEEVQKKKKALYSRNNNGFSFQTILEFQTTEKERLTYRLILTS